MKPIKRILFINNYDMAKSRDSYLKGNSPSHHQFGTSELIKTNEYVVDYMLATPKNVKYKVLKLLSLFPVWFKIYWQARKYDIVYGGADFTVDFLGVMKNMNLFRPKLIAIFHHPPFSLRLRYAKYDKIIFLSPFSYEEMKHSFPNKKEQMTFMKWGPDLNFYKRLAAIPNYMKQHEKIIFISNGKTRRDHEILISASEHLHAHTVIVSDEESIPSNFDKDSCHYARIILSEQPDDTKMVKLLNDCSILVIPTSATPQRLGPIGLTSFLDAIALGMPMITANNTVFSDIIESHEMGIVYKAGELIELEKAMSFFIDHPESIAKYGENAYKYGQKNSIKEFAQHLYQIF